MGSDTGINWTDSTWNPIRGCSRVSEGCRNCYAERVAARFSGPGKPYEGFAQVIAPRDLLDRTGGRRNGWTRKVSLVPKHLADPLRWKKPRRIFVNSMSDLFHEALSNEDIAAVFGVMAAAPRHTFQCLTKRAKRMREWFAWVEREAGCTSGRLALVMGEAVKLLPEVPPAPRGDKHGPLSTSWPLPNVWIGVSVENQNAAWERIPDLLATPAAVRFLSAEPLLGPVGLNAMGSFRGEPLSALEEVVGHVNRPKIDWVIVGCESGPGARPCAVEWIRLIRDQCTAAGVALWLKQAEESADLGEDRLLDIGDDDSIAFGEGSRMKPRRPGGNHIIDLPYLDGRQHHDFPVTPSIVPVA